MNIFEIIQNDDQESLEQFVQENDLLDYIPPKPPTLNKQDEILGNGAPLISIAAFYSARNCFEYLQLNGANFDISDHAGLKVVHFASMGGSDDICDIIDSIGADFTEITPNGQTCLHFACEYGHFSLVQRFLTRNFQIDATTNQLMTPLHYACLKEIQIL